LYVLQPRSVFYRKACSSSHHIKGADLSHVICSPTAAGAIKSYSPDLIVHPILREDKYAHTAHTSSSHAFPHTHISPSLHRSTSDLRPELTSLLKRLHVLVVGPGLGREPYMQSFARLAIDIAKEQEMYLVLDADALLLVGQDKGLVDGYVRSVLTPNVVEFKRLSEALVRHNHSPLFIHD
jgi:ATP-dependent NAD(P)H-hydrate dehydratase